MDKQNRKFSKSLGNGIDPIEMIENHDFSPDALRLFILSKASHLDMKISQNWLIFIYGLCYNKQSNRGEI